MRKNVLKSYFFFRNNGRLIKNHGQCVLIVKLEIPQIAYPTIYVAHLPKSAKYFGYF